MPRKHTTTTGEPREQVLYSPILHNGSVRVSDRQPSTTAARLSGTRLKNRIFPILHRLIRHTPVAVAMAPVRIAGVLLRLLYAWPGNPLRVACERISAVAAPAGHRHDPARVYRRYIANAVGAIENFFVLYRHGAARVLPRVTLTEEDSTRIRQLIAEHGGIVLAVPHNLGSAFSALRIGHHFDMLLVAKNAPTVERTRMAIDFYQRMRLSLLMIRGGNSFEIARSLYEALTSGKLVAATLDNIDRTPTQERICLFGHEIGLSNWAAKIAARKRIPVIPAYFRSEGTRIEVIVGEALIARDIRQTVAHYARFFESQILADPASWAYLADKHWQRHLADVQHGTNGKD